MQPTREQERQESSRFDRWFLGPLESTATFLSGQVSAPAGGIASLATLGLTGNLDAAVDVGEAVTDKFTYTPRTEAGKDINRFVTRKIGEGIEYTKRNVPGVAEYGEAKEELGTSMPLLGAGVAAAEQFALDRVGIKGQPKLGMTDRPSAGVQSYEQVAEAGQGARTGTGGSNRGTVDPHFIPLMEGRQRVAYPGIYGRPDEIAAGVNLDPEDAMMKRLWGVDRQDLYDIAMTTQGNPDWIPEAWRSKKTGERKPGTSASALAIQGPGNTQRLHDLFDEAARRNPELVRGMGGWYPLDPLYDRQVQLLGPVVGRRMFSLQQDLSGMASPGSNVLDEIGRGSGAAYLAQRNRFDEFFDPQRGGVGGSAFPNDPLLAPMVGHPYHSTSQAKPMQGYLASILEDPVNPKYPDSAKVPSYIEQSYPQSFGNQLRGQRHVPVADAHFARGVGLSDVRTNQGYAQSASAPEANTLQPWYRGIAQQHGWEAGPAQGIQWGLLGPQTGVTSPVGAPKLELITRNIVDTARRLGISPERARDMYLTGELPIFRDPATR